MTGKDDLDCFQALAHTPSVDVTVTVIVISWHLLSYPFVYISVLCINLCSFMSCMRLSIAFACVL